MLVTQRDGDSQQRYEKDQISSPRKAEQKEPQEELGWGGSEVKASACNAGDLGSILGSGRSPGEGNGTPLQYSRLENPMDGGAWWAAVHGVAQSGTRLSDDTLRVLKAQQ